MLFLSFHVDAGRDRSREVGVTRASDGDTVDQVVVTWPGFDPDDAETGGLLRSNGLQIQLSPKLGPRTSAEVSRLMASAVAAIVSTDPFDRSVFDSARRLRVVARVGVGTDTIDLSAATKAGVVIITTPDANEETVADHTLALILGAVRRVVEHDASVRRGEWNRAGRLTAWDLHGCTVGLVGFGRIGQEVARRLRGFGVNLMACDPFVKPPNEVKLVDLDELLGSADIVSLHVPLLPTTLRLIGRREIALMRPEAILVNTSRGGVVDEESLIEALASRRVRAAALDVFEDEPPTSRQLLELPNVVLTPHIAGLSVDSIRVMVSRATRAVVDVLQGRQVDGVVNPEALRYLRSREADGGES